MGLDISAFWDTVTPVVFHAGVLSRAAHEVDLLQQFLEPFGKNARILDLCCGVGRHCVVLAERGYSVTGLDREQGYIRRARAAARQKGLPVEFVVADFPQSGSKARYDVILCLWNSFGFCTSECDDKRFLKGVLRHLERNGVFVLGTVGQEVAHRTFVPKKVRDVGSYKLVKMRSLSDDGRYLRGKWIVYKDAVVLSEFDIAQRLYSEVDMKVLLSRVGFSHVVSYGDWDARPYDLLANQLLIVAKP